MSKTLVVTYLPRGERSKTKKLVDKFLSLAEGKTEIVHLDLNQEHPDFLDTENLTAMMKRNYGGEELSADEQKLVVKFDYYVDQVLSADHVVVAYPIYNYGAPAVVKAWIDGIVQNNKTFKFTDTGFAGLASGKGLSIITSGGIYEDTDVMMGAAYRYMEECLKFIGINAQRVILKGADMLPPEELNTAQEKCFTQLEGIVQEWYG